MARSNDGHTAGNERKQTPKSQNWSFHLKVSMQGRKLESSVRVGNCARVLLEFLTAKPMPNSTGLFWTWLGFQGENQSQILQNSWHNVTPCIGGSQASEKDLPVAVDGKRFLNPSCTVGSLHGPAQSRDKLDQISQESILKLHQRAYCGKGVLEASMPTP